MSAWGFLSKAEGFLDRVLEEQGKNSAGVKKSAAGGISNVESGASRPNTPTARWQDRLSKAASQFTSTDSLNTLNTPAVTANDDKEALQVTSSSGASDAIVETSASANTNDQGAVKTELQMSRIFPPNMPSYVEDIPTTRSSTHAVPTSEDSDRVIPIVADAGEVPANDSLTEGNSSQAPSAKTSVEVQRHSTANGRSEMADPCADMIQRLQGDLEACESRRIEEAQVNAERISALERRLAYFSDESLSKTREIARAGDSTAHQKELAEKDARIAMLLEEGDTLSKKELQHLTNIKKLRSRISELESLIATSLKAVDKADSDRAATQKETKDIRDSLKRAEAKVKDFAKLEGEVGDLKAESQVKSRIISDLKRKLADADDTISQNVTIFTQLQAEKSKTESLQKRIGTLLTEAKATAEENASDMADLQGKFDRLVERSKGSEAEKQSEIARLEGEIELLRANLEETTTNASENSQAKLLRQIESLQTQQSLARQNWARIEESLVMRSTHAEKERDELREQEDDLRNRLRQAVLSRKDTEEERSIAQSRIRILESTAQESQEQIQYLMKQLEMLKKDLTEEQQARVAEKETFATTLETRLQERLAEERQTLQASTPHSPYLHDMMSRSGYSFQRHIPDSPNMTRTPDNKRPSMHSRAPTQTSRVPSRRKTSQYSFFDDVKSPPIRDEDPFDQEDASQLRPHTEVSISTASAGASVGMMERVTANVRKLEMEMNIMKEDLSRMTRQRDEARSTCMEMEKVEVERNHLLQKVASIAAEKDRLKNKFDATLELLGEQTEENEQLKEDIVDMRKAFKETLSSVGMGA